jgi:hypothetical protein
MAITVFKDSTYSLSTLVEEIDRGEIGLPDIQRPFVWADVKVRDLFDSMYQGFPVGILLFWATGAEVGARKIGTQTKQAAPRLMIVDGQQRLTSLFAVLTGNEIVKADYTQRKICIAFRPLDSTFDVSNPVIENNPEYISDISVLWGDTGRRKVVSQFVSRLEARDGELASDTRDDLEEAIDQLYDLHNYPFKVMELSSSVAEEVVANVFVRINSEGVNLNEADFILTLMSVWWEDGRKELEEFARASVVGDELPSPANPFIDVKADQLLRVVAGLAFRRARLSYVYQGLSGKDLETGEVSAEIRERQFAKLEKAQVAVVDLTNWHEFLKGLRRAGYLSGRMISSELNLLSSYLIYLIGRTEYKIDPRELREVLARWFFMASLTGRYTGNFEAQVERDLRGIDEVKSAEEFIQLLDNIIDTELTNDFWEIQLPSRLATSAASGPVLYAYNASLVLLSARPLFSRLSLVELMEPTLNAPRSAIERHHLFPKAYLQKLGIDKPVEYNQIANQSFVEWPDNAAIGARAPSEYFPSLFAELGEDEQNKARFWHALPDGWEDMEYSTFLEARRQLIADVIRKAFTELRSGRAPIDDQMASSPHPPPLRSVAELVSEMETEGVEFKSSAYYSYNPDIPPHVILEGVLKTVAGFLNGSGGVLAIGIGDEGEILGVGPDLHLKNMTLDEYVNALTTAIATALGALSATLTKIEVENVDGEDICLLHVACGPEPVYAKVRKGDQVFFVRVNNTTRMLEGPDLVGYISQRWGASDT